MEGILIVGAELLLLPFAAGLTALFELCLSLVSLILRLLYGAGAKRLGKDQGRSFKLPPRLVKWIQRVAVGSALVFVAALLIVNSFFLEPLVRYAADRVEAKTGFAIEYGSMEGNLFAGRFSFSDLELRQSLSDKPQLSALAQGLDVDLSVWKLTWGKRVLESAVLSQAHVTLQTIPKQKANDDGYGFAIAWRNTRLDGIEVSKSPLLKSSPFIIEDLRIEGMEIHVDDRAAAIPTAYDIEIERFHAEPLRSHFAVFDLLFRSNLTGRLNGSEIEIVNTEAGGFRHTSWAANNIPAPTLSSLVGGPFLLFEAGSVDVQVADQWENNQIEALDLDWNIRVSEARAGLPEGTPQFLKPFAQVCVDNINRSGRDWEFGFQLQFSESQFKGASSLSAQQIWADSVPIFLKQVAELTGVEESVVKEKTKSAFDAFKNFFENRKKK